MVKAIRKRKSSQTSLVPADRPTQRKGSMLNGVRSSSSMPTETNKIEPIGPESGGIPSLVIFEIESWRISVMAGARKKPRGKDGVYQGYYVDWTGKRRTFRGTTDRKDTIALARKLEDDDRQIALGYRSPPKASDAPRRFFETAAEYCQWGEAKADGAADHGGRNTPGNVAASSRGGENN